MSATLYDNAIVERFRSWTGDNHITITPPDDLFSYRAHIDNDEVKLPIISLNRVGMTLLDTSKQPKSYDGMSIEISKDKSFKLRAVPVRINYQVDVITRFRKECDALVRELIFKIINNPTITVQVPFNNYNGFHNFNILLGEDVDDNSDIVEHNERGEYFRQTLNLYTDDAYLFSYKEHENKTLEVCVEADLKVETEIGIDVDIKPTENTNKN